MGEIADRAWAWRELEREYIERIQKHCHQLVKEIRGQSGRIGEIARILKEWYGHSGHSLDSLDPADGVCGFMDFNAKGVHVTRYSFDPDSDPEETDNDQETEIHFTWNDYARAVIHWMNGETWAESLNIPAKQKPGAAPGDKKGQEEKTMTMLAKTTETRALTLADYEARIHLYKEQIGTGYIGIGRTLIEAKEAKVVPHGQWETWVTVTTGLTPRQAQRCMQAATEIKDGTAMARLEMSKALLLLSSGLDEEQREEIATKAVDEGATVKQLKEELRKAKLQVVQETGAAAEIRDALKKTEDERRQLENQLKATETAYRQRMDQEAGKAYQRGLDECATEIEKQVRKEFQDKIDYINGERRQADERIRDLQAKLKDAEKAGSARWDAGFEAGKAQGRADTMHENDRIEAELIKNRNALEVVEDIRKRQREEINRIKEESGKEYEGLRNELAKQTQYAADLKRNQADLLAAAEDAEKRAADAEAELEALRAGRDPANEPAAVILGKAVSAFFSECELMPFYPEGLTKDRGAVKSLVDNLEDWCMRMQRAIAGAAVEAEGAIE